MGGRPHRAAEARRILPIRASMSAHYCKDLPGEVGSWVCLLVEVHNFLYLGGKTALGGEVLNDTQRTALESLITSMEEQKILVDLGRIRFDYTREMVAVMEDLAADKVIAWWPTVGEEGIQPAERL